MIRLLSLARASAGSGSLVDQGVQLVTLHRYRSSQAGSYETIVFIIRDVNCILDILVQLPNHPVWLE